MRRSGRPNCVVDLAVGRPLVGTVWRRGRREEQAGIVDQDAVVGVSVGDRVDLCENRTLVSLASRRAAAPVTVEPIEGRNGRVDQAGQNLARAALDDEDVPELLERLRRGTRERRSHLDRHDGREHLCEEPCTPSAIRSGLDCAYQAESCAEVTGELLRRDEHAGLLAALATVCRMKAVADSSFFLVANGNPDSPPASGLRDYLAQHARRLDAVFHPLSQEDPPLHRIMRWESGELVRTRSLRLPSHPPATYLLDALAPFRRSRADAWVGFSNLSAVHGIARRRAGLTSKVAYWAVDFVPDRFGADSVLTQVYDRIDRFAATHADLRVELTAAARDGRSERLGLARSAAQAHVAPVGAWLDRIEQAPADGWRSRRIVFIGHLVPRQGVAMLIRALAELPDVRLDIAGRGPEEGALRALVDELGISGRVRFHGFLADHRDVERLVASASVAAAPYATDMESFTRYADPSKLRTYTAVGLPIVLTDVPPNAQELAREAGAEVVAYEPGAIADGVRRILSSPAEWQRRRQAAIDYSAAFDWARIVPLALERLGFD